MTIFTVIGARPQFVKAAIVSQELKRRGISQVLVHTGQHYDANMSDVFFRELDIPEPDQYLAIGSMSHGAQTGRMVEAIERSLLEVRPDWVLVYGDTNSTFAGALAAVKLHIPVAHVEAGLRSFNRRMPEEINRILTDHCADLLFVPTQRAVENLQNEGIAREIVEVVGDVMYDAAVYYGKKAEGSSDILKRLQIQPREFILATIHRAENTDSAETLRIIFDGLSQVAEETPLILPLHPRTRAALERIDLLESVAEHIRFIDPVGYLDMVMLEKNARLIVTDSGGVQKEAFFYRVPCATLRNETEWMELVELGWNRLVPIHSADSVAAEVKSALHQPEGKEAAPYGDGRASVAIVDRLLKGRA